MRCPECSCEDDKVLETRPSKDRAMIRRRRECTSCGFRFSTQEEILRPELLVVKGDGRSEELNLQKIRYGLKTACRKLPVSEDQIEKAIERIKKNLAKKYEKEIPSREIGNFVMEELRELNPVAFIRFASVYHHFSNPEQFIAHVEEMRLDHDGEAR